jgi:hypothetical protein
VSSFRQRLAAWRRELFANHRLLAVRLLRTRQAAPRGFCYPDFPRVGSAPRACEALAAAKNAHIFTRPRARLLSPGRLRIRFNRRLTKSPHYSGGMPDDPDRYLTLRQADQARTDFALIESDLEFLMQQTARLRGELWRICLIGTLGGSVLTTALGLAFVLH